MFKAITRLDLVEGGNIIKQGAFVTLGFTPRDENGNVVVLTNKNIHVAIIGRDGIVYETTAVYDSSKSVIRFSITEIIDYGDMWMEFTVTSPTDPKYRMKFPSNEQDGKLKIIRSADAMDIVGVQMTTVAELKAEQEALQKAFENKVEPKVAAVEKVAVDLTKRVNDGIGAFTEDTEVLDARMGESNLRKFNEKTIAQLADIGNHKADKDYVEGLVQDLGASATFKGSATKAEILALTGMKVGDEWYDTTNKTSIRYNGQSWVDVGGGSKLGDNSVSAKMLQNKVVTLDKLAFDTVTTATRSKNLFNKQDSAMQDGYFIRDTTGEFVLGTTSTYTSSALYTEVIASASYVFSHHFSHAFYDSNFMFITGKRTTVISSLVVTAPANAKYIRYSVPIANKEAFMFATGAALPEYEPYGGVLNPNTIQSKHIVNKSITKDKVDFEILTPTEKSANLFDINGEIQTGYFIRESDGTVSVSTSGTYNAILYYIEVKPNHDYAFSHHFSHAFYDGNYNYITGKRTLLDENSPVYKAPENAKYVRFSVHKDKMASFSFRELNRRLKKDDVDLDGLEKSIETAHKNIETANESINAVKSTLISQGLTTPILKVLMIGNSFSVDAQSYIHNIASSAGVDVVFGNLFMDGQTLEGHYAQIATNASAYSYAKKTASLGVIGTAAFNDYSFDRALADEDWDVITLQQRSPLTGLYDTFEPYLSNIISYIKSKKNTVKIGWHSTWAYSSDSTHAGFLDYNKDQMTMYEAITNATKQTLKNADLDFLIPNTTAIQNARTAPELLSLNRELTQDGYHLATTGDYIAGLTLYQTLIAELYNRDVEAYVNFSPEGVSKYHSLLAKIAVKNAISKPFSVTDIS